MGLGGVVRNGFGFASSGLSLGGERLPESPHCRMQGQVDDGHKKAHSGLFLCRSNPWVGARVTYGFGRGFLLLVEKTVVTKLHTSQPEAEAEINTACSGITR